MPEAMPDLLEKTIHLMCNRTALAEALADCALVVPKRTTKPILMLVKLSGTPELGVTLSATDLECGIIRRVLGVQLLEPVNVLLPPERLLAILRGADDEEIALTVHETKITVRARQQRFTLDVDDAAQFPDIPGFHSPDYHSMNPGDLKKAINRTVYATDPVSDRYALGGVLFDVGDLALKTVATDGRRLAVQEIAAEPTGNGFGKKPVVVPVKALELIERLMDPLGAPARISGDQSDIRVQLETVVVYSRLVEGRFPRYQDIFPNAPKKTICKVNAGVLANASTAARIVTNEESRGICFDWNGGTLKISGQATSIGDGELEVDIETVSGDPVTVWIDVRYMSDSLKTLDPASELTVELVDDKTAIVMRTPDGATLVIMPLTPAL